MEDTLYIEETYEKSPPQEPKFPEIKLTIEGVKNPELIKGDHRILKYMSDLEKYEKDLAIWQSQFKQWKIGFLENKLKELKNSK